MPRDYLTGLEDVQAGLTPWPASWTLRTKDEGERVNTIIGRVERGAALLDEKRPGWWKNIDLGRLDISAGCDCVAGQLDGFSEMMRGLGLLSLEAQVAHGFEADDEAGPRTPLSVVYDAAERDYRALTEAWRGLIRQRRLAASVTP